MEVRAEAFRPWARDIERERGWTPAARAMLSLQAAAAGWGAITLVYFGFTLFRGANSFFLLSIATGLVVAVGWLLFGLPLAVAFSPYQWPMRWPWTPLFGAAYAGLAVALLRSPFPSWKPLEGFGSYAAALIGAVAGAVYGFRVRTPRQE